MSGDRGVGQAIGRAWLSQLYHAAFGTYPTRVARTELPYRLASATHPISASILNIESGAIGRIVIYLPISRVRSDDVANLAMSRVRQVSDAVVGCSDGQLLIVHDGWIRSGHRVVDGSRTPAMAAMSSSGILFLMDTTWCVGAPPPPFAIRTAATLSVGLPLEALRLTGLLAITAQTESCSLCLDDGTRFGVQIANTEGENWRLSTVGVVEERSWGAEPTVEMPVNVESKNGDLLVWADGHGRLVFDRKPRGIAEWVRDGDTYAIRTSPENDTREVVT